jgi:transcriptional regulator with XRE-family HTH domain
MSQTALARQLGITRQWMWEMEREASDPCASRLLRLAEVLQVDVRYLLGLLDEQQESA